MKIGLIDVDSHAKVKKWGSTVYPNLALCKIASYHKRNGDDVEWYDAMFGGEYDKVYASKIFNFSPDVDFVIHSKEVVRGGTGYDLSSVLPQDIDDCQPDYSIYQSVHSDISFGFLTRGCPNKCKWCVVPRKEGTIRPYWDIDRVANGNRNIILMDNNLLAAGEYACTQLERIIERGYCIDLNQASDARLLTEEHAMLFSRIKWLGNRIRFGCDTHAQIEECHRAIRLIKSYGYKGEFFLYTMLNDDFTESYSRIMHWWKVLQDMRRNHIGGQIYAYAQPYRDPVNPHRPVPTWQTDMANWVNKRMVFCTTSFEDFEPRKGFKCKKHIASLYKNLEN